MPGYLSRKHEDARADLINSLRVHIRHNVGSIAKAARIANIDGHGFARILRLDRPASLSKLEEIGNALGLELVLSWRKRGE